MTRLVNPLVRQGFVERLPDPGDRRVIGVTLTAQGRRVLRRVEQQLSDAYARVAEEIPRSEQSPVRAVLTTLIAAIDRARLHLG